MKDILKIYVSVVLSVILVTVFLAMRLPEEKSVHFHANFGAFVSGQKLDFSDQKFMHVESCSAESSADEHSAKAFGDRIHLEDGVGDVAHIHDSGVVWGDLMLYLRMKVTEDGIYVDGKNNLVGRNQEISYYINGNKLDEFDQSDIKSNDILLLVLDDKSPNDQKSTKLEIDKLGAQLSMKSEEMNQSNPDVGCGGGVKEESFWQNVSKVWGF